MSLSSFAPLQHAVLPLGFSDADLRGIEKTVGNGGARLIQSGGAAAADIIVIDDGEDYSGEHDGQRGGAGALIVRTSLDGLDDALDRYPEAELVVGRDPIDLHLALAGALARVTSGKPAMFDVASDEGLRLQRLADEIARIARTLVELPDGLSGGAAASPVAPEADAPNADLPGSETPATAAEVRAIIRLRRMRERFFSAELFADPAWDMLLDLAAARIERVRVAVSSLCIAAAVPPTTALRWIKAMTDRGLLRRVADPHDARRIFIQLSDEAATAMELYLRAARSTIGRAI